MLIFFGHSRNLHNNFICIAIYRSALYQLLYDRAYSGMLLFAFTHIDVKKNYMKKSKEFLSYQEENIAS